MIYKIILPALILAALVLFYAAFMHKTKRTNLEKLEYTIDTLYIQDTTYEIIHPGVDTFYIRMGKDEGSDTLITNE